MLLQQAQAAALESGHAFCKFSGPHAALEDLQDEVNELVEAIKENQGKLHVRNEVGDVVFSLINICRQQGIDFEETIEKFASRWLARKSLQEDKIRAAGCDWRTIPPEQNEQIWKQVKKELKQQEYEE